MNEVLNAFINRRIKNAEPLTLRTADGRCYEVDPIDFDGTVLRCRVAAETLAGCEAPLRFAEPYEAAFFFAEMVFLK